MTISSASGGQVDAGEPAAGGTEPSEGAHRLPYLPALDGLRTLALLAVLLEHGGVAVVAGGHFGVTVFFVLSGFLVTALLLQERAATGAIDLAAFWRRRARRLVPASLVLVAFATLYLAFGAARAPSTVVGDGLASLAWLANWRFLLSDRSYADLFSDPTPFAHLWSLAVEEQFYVVLPLVAAATLRLRRPKAAFGAALAVAAVGSTTLLVAFHEPGADPMRSYYGTDTRVAELLIGALLAVALVGPRGLRTFPRRALAPLGGMGFLALAGIVVFVVRLSSDDAGTYEGGLTIVALLAAVVVTACTQRTSLATLLTTEPLPQLGRLTYGAYLFHWPVFLWIDADSTGLEEPALLSVRIVATFTLALFSYAFIEEPIRYGSIPSRIGALAWANGSVALAAVLVLVVATVEARPAGSQLASGAGGMPAAVPPPPPPVAAATPTKAPPSTMPAPAGTGAGGAPAAAEPGGGAGADGPASPLPAAPPPASDGQPRATPAPPTSSTTTTTAPVAPAGALRVVVVGDSLAENLGLGLQRWSAGRTDASVYNLSIQGCPISRGGTRRFPDGQDFHVPRECDWWDSPSERLQRLRQFDPHVVLIEDALNEVVDRKLPSWPDYRGPGDPRFDAWLLDEYRQAASVLSSQGATVVFADAPCADWQRLNNWRSIHDADERVAALNRIYDSVVAATTKVADLYDRLCPDGWYTDTVEDVENGRPDGFHLSDAAADRLAARWLAPFLQSARGPTGI